MKLESDKNVNRVTRLSNSYGNGFSVNSEGHIHYTVEKFRN